MFRRVLDEAHCGIFAFALQREGYWNGMDRMRSALRGSALFHAVGSMRNPSDGLTTRTPRFFAAMETVVYDA